MNNELELDPNGLKKEMLRLLSASLLPAVLVTIVLAFTLAVILSAQVPQAHLFRWFTALICISVIRLFILYKYKHLQSPGLRDLNKYLYAFRTGVLSSGLFWGWSGYFFMDHVDTNSQLYISFMLAGLIAAATSSLATDKYSILVFFVPVLCPHIFYYLTMGGSIAYGMVVGLTFFAVFMAATARVQGKNLLDNYLLRLEAVRSENQVKHLAYYDSLTGLPNRSLLKDRVEQSLTSAERNEEIIGVMFMDLDGFKDINDTYGHDVGDKLLKQVAERIASKIRRLDTLSRIGGDEFIILLPEVTSKAGVMEVAEKIRLAIATPFHIEKNTLNVSSSIGVAVYPEHGKVRNTLLKHADTAMYRAKELGKNNVQLYVEE